jgi:hypothetical protein
MTARVFSDDLISVTTGRGTIIGGTLTAGRMIQAKMIGSQAGMKTELTLGEQPYLMEKLHNDESNLQNIRQELQDLTIVIEDLEMQQGMEADMGDKLAKARLRRSVLSMKENQLMKRKEAPPPEPLDLLKCRLECDTIYPVTNLKIGRDIWRATAMRRYCRLGYNPETYSIREVKV